MDLLDRVLNILFYNPFEERFKRKRILSVSLSEEGYSILYTSRGPFGPGMRLSEEFPVSDGAVEPEDVASAVKTMIVDRGLKPQQVLLVLPDEWVLAVPLRLPAAVLENPSEVLAYEMDRFTPFTEEEVFYDYRLLRKTDGEVVLVLYLVKRERVVPFITAFEKEGLGLTSVTFQSAAVAPVVSSRVGKADLMIVKKMDGVARRTLVSNAVYLYGDECSIEEVSAAPIQAPEAVNPTTVVTLGNRLHLEGEVSAEEALAGTINTNGSYTTLTAEAASVVVADMPEKAVNLLSMAKRQAPRRSYWVSALLSVLILGVLSLLLIIPMIELKRQTEELSRIVEKMRPEVQATEALLNEKKALRERINRIRQYLPEYSKIDILREVTQLLPEDTWLTGLTISENRIRLEGYADSSTALIPLLEKSPHIKNVRFSSPTYKDARMNKEKFRIEGELQ